MEDVVIPADITEHIELLWDTALCIPLKAKSPFRGICSLHLKTEE
jgi:hypothetical protein